MPAGINCCSSCARKTCFTYWVQNERPVCVEFNLAFILVGFAFRIPLHITQDFVETDFGPHRDVCGFPSVVHDIEVHVKETRPGMV